MACNSLQCTMTSIFVAKAPPFGARGAGRGGARGPLFVADPPPLWQQIGKVATERSLWGHLLINLGYLGRPLVLFGGPLAPLGRLFDGPFSHLVRWLATACKPAIQRLAKAAMDCNVIACHAVACNAIRCNSHNDVRCNSLQ